MPALADRQLAPDNRVFQFLTQPTLTRDGEGVKAKRKFAGVGYSGEVIPGHWYWDNVIFDLHTMAVNPSLPALIDHDRGQRAGYVTDHAISDQDGFTVEGVLMSNPAGVAVAQESDDGFPWQMSVHIEPGSIEEVQAGTNITVNGKNLPGPLTVFRNSRIVEVSFTATGHDSNTSATAMSRPSGGQPQTSTGEFSMTPEQIAAMQAENTRLTAANATLTGERDTAVTELTQFSAARREADVKQLFSDTGREFKADDADAVMLASLPQGAFDFSAKQMRDAKKAAPSAPTGLFSHQAAAGQEPVTAPVNPLLANATARATSHSQFTKR